MTIETTTTTSKKRRGLLWWTGRIIGALVLLLAGFLAFSLIRHQRATAADLAQYPPPGVMVDVGGHSLHLDCRGQGSPTVLLEAGAGGWSMAWAAVHDDLAQTTRVCAYDRAGLGWSQPGPEPRTIEQIVAELHTLLENAGEAGPYVLVGHSFGGPIVRVFADQYPEQVVGMVLVDSAHEDQVARFPPEYGQLVDGTMAQFQVLELVARLGLMRGGEAYIPDFGISEELKPAYYSIMARPGFYAAYAAEMAVFEQSLAQAQSIGSLGDLPLMVLTAGDFTIDGLSPEIAEAMRTAWFEMQAELAGLSTNSSQIVVENSTHYIQQDQPGQVIEAVLQVVEMARE